MPRSLSALLLLGLCLAEGAGAQGVPPPRDPRLVPPQTQDTTVPPPIVTPPPPKASPDAPVRPLTADEAARIALRLQPNIGIARSALRAQQGRTRQVRSGLLPQLTVNGNYNYVHSFHSAERAGTAGTGGTGTGTTGTGTGGTGTGTSAGRAGGTMGTGTGTTGTGATGTGGTGSAGTGTTGGAGGTGAGGTGSTGGSGAGSTGTGGTGTGGPGSTGTGGAGSTGSGGTGTGGTGAGTGGTGTGGTGAGTTGTGVSPTVITPFGGSSTLAVPGFLAEAVLRQLLYDFDHTRNLVRQSATLERAAAHDITRVQSDTVFLVKQAFYTYAQYAALVRVNEGEVANRQAQLDLATARYNIGLGLPSDIVTAQTAKAEAILNLNLARNDAKTARINLALLMGIDPRTPLQIADTGEAPIPSNDVNGLTQTALRQRPEILLAQANIEAAKYGVRAARTTNAPTITGDILLESAGDQFIPQNDLYAIGVAIAWTPFDGGLTRGRVDEARANAETAQYQLTAAQLQVTSDVGQAYSDLRSAEQRVEIAAADVTNAQEGVRIAEGRYQTGIGQFIDIITAQSFLLTARINQVTTRYAVEANRAALARALGSPLR